MAVGSTSTTTARSTRSRRLSESVEGNLRARRLTRRAARLVIERQLITAEQVHRHGLRARDVSHSNGVALVESGHGRGFAVKDTRLVREAEQGSPEREVALYRAASRRAELRPLAPELLHYDPDEGVLILEALLTSRRLDMMTGRRDVLDPEVAGWLGEALATWHREAAAVEELEAADPWMLHLDGSRRLSVLDRDPRLSEVTERILGDAACCGVVGSARRAWREETVIHGDIRFANVMVCPSPPAVRFIDWETSGRGDPAWDLGAAIQEYLSVCIGGGHQDPIPVARQAVGALLDGYAGAAEQQIGWRRLAPFVACRLLMRAIQLANWEGDGAEAIDWHLALAPAVTELQGSPFTGGREAPAS